MRLDGDLNEAIDLQRYPIIDKDGSVLRACIGRIRADLDSDGCSVLSGFMRSSHVGRLREESRAVAPLAYRKVETVNAYNIARDAKLPDDHPARITFERGNAFVARDQIPGHHLIHRLYLSASFQDFIAACFGVPSVFPMTDGLAGLVVNVLEPGREHPWHFDTNAFTVSLLTQPPEAGGAFEYVPDIRSTRSENLPAVRDVITGADRSGVRRLQLNCGDLQLFKGRYALHRVAPVEGAGERLTAIFAYCEQPGVVGSPQRTRQLFGRVLEMHEARERPSVRADALLD